MTATETPFDPDGYIKDPNAWNREPAQAIASREGILQLGDDHWRVIDEYPIPVADAKAMLKSLCLRPIIDKRRYRVEHAGMPGVIDEFLGENAGLVVAEIELETAQQPFDKPAWVGEEVTTDPRFFNANLVASPYTAWE